MNYIKFVNCSCVWRNYHQELRLGRGSNDKERRRKPVEQKIRFAESECSEADEGLQQELADIFWRWARANCGRSSAHDAGGIR